MSKYKILIKYTIEFIVIVSGVSASFLGEEYREGLQNENERIKALNNIKIELDEIDTYCEERKNNYVKDRNVLKYLLGNPDYAFDTIDNLVQSSPGIAFALNDYREFQPPMNRYNSIINEGTIKFIKSDSVKQQLSELHNTFYSYLNSIVDDEKVIQQKLSFYLAENYPKVILLETYDTEKKTYYNLLSKAVNNDEILKALIYTKYRKMGIKNYFLDGYVEKLIALRNKIEITLINQ
jgi:hypothetical protein|tara:strand:- start:684 stop:1394 length:711 start_codon:yes stop_codon:yes gene_type:complete